MILGLLRRSIACLLIPALLQSSWAGAFDAPAAHRKINVGRFLSRFEQEAVTQSLKFNITPFFRKPAAWVRRQARDFAAEPADILGHAQFLVFKSFKAKLKYYTKVALLEETIFRGGAFMIPLKPLALAISGPVFLFSHTIVRWLLRRETPAWKGWKREIRSEFGPSFIRSRFFAALLFNLPFLLLPQHFLAAYLTSAAIHLIWEMTKRMVPVSIPEVEWYPPEQDAANDKVLQTLGLTYEQFQKFARGMDEFEQNLLKNEPLIAKHIFSLRTQKRIAPVVLRLTQLFREKGIPHPLAQAVYFAIDQFYGDLAGKTIPREYMAPLAGILDVALPDHGLVKLMLGGHVGLNGETDQLVARALTTADPVLFSEAAGSDAGLMASLQRITEESGAKLTTVWCHPFTEERQIIGHHVFKEGENRIVFGYGVFTRAIREAEKDGAHKHVLLLKNVEAMPSEVRTQINELLNFRKLTHPELGEIRLPPEFPDPHDQRSRGRC